MEKIIKIISLIAIGIYLTSCFYSPRGVRYYMLVNETSDTILYGHSYLYYNASNIHSQQETTIKVDVVDTIPPMVAFHFASVDFDQRFDAKNHCLATTLEADGVIIPHDSTSCYLKYQGKIYYVYPLKDSFFYTRNYEYDENHTAYVFYLREYLEKLEAAE